MDPVAPYTLVPNVGTSTEAPASGFVSRVLHNTEDTRIIQFTFAPEAELAAHSAPCPVTICVVRGSAVFRVGSETHVLESGALLHLPPKLEHSVRANKEMCMLLIMNKGARV